MVRRAKLAPLLIAILAGAPAGDSCWPRQSGCSPRLFPLFPSPPSLSPPGWLFCCFQEAGSSGRSRECSHPAHRWFPLPEQGP